MSAKEEIQAILNDEEKFNGVTKEAFDAFDQNGSGELEPNELRQALNQIADQFGGEHLDDEKFFEELKKLDKDSDSKINFDEFKPIIAKFLQDAIAMLG